MVRSMTGFGRSQKEIDGLAVTVEIKSVNHRFYEFSSRIPRAYGFLDEKLKNFFQQSIVRGKVDVFVQIETVETADCQVSINRPLAQGYLTALRTLAEEYGLRDDISVSALSRYPDVLTVRQAELDEEALWNAVKPVASEALEHFLQMREREGQKLKEDVLSRGKVILENVAQIESRSPETVKEHMEKVEARIRELLNGVPVDEARLLNEAAVYADKIAVAEETVRLRSHIDQLEQLLAKDEAVGRKLDFLVQEMNREANTIGSKCSDLELTHRVLDIKAEIEKIREQIQNIE